MPAPDPAAGSDPGRIVLLTTTHRVAPGMLSWAAWEVLRGADLVRCADAGHPHLPWLREAGIEPVLAEVDAHALLDETAGGRTVVVLVGAEGDRRLTDRLASLAGSGRVAMPALELLPGSWDLPGARLIDLVQVMDRIRRDCPWTSVQTHEGLVKYALEEAHELVEAIETGDRVELREELGDVLLQVVLHARIAQDAEPGEAFSVDDVAAGLVDKLIRRHPHLFAAGEADTPEAVHAAWQAVKAQEKDRESVTDGVPLAQPALALAAKLTGRARAAGLPDPARVSGSGPVSGAGSSEGPVRDVDAGPGADPAVEAAFGAELLVLADRAGRAGVDPETALRRAARGYRAALRVAEGLPAEPVRVREHADAEEDGYEGGAAY
ncbi:MazG family protein [Streptomyces sp. BI20]|uniref:MazG family protein n=1 Tax=Streptomyces sp. BI20 TaxID=3403460 RepID=UPI003C789810